MDGYGLQGMHAATHVVGPSGHRNSLVWCMILVVLSTERAR